MAGGKLKIDIRRQKVLDMLKNEGQVTVNQLSSVLGTTPVTIRNDLDTLAREGRLVRTRGGAVKKTEAVQPDWRLGDGNAIQMREEKTAIAQRVLDYIHDGDTLFINSGTTTQLVAETLSRRRGLHVVTTSLAVASYMTRLPGIHVVLLGGELNANYGFTYGGDAVEQLRRYRPDWCILSVDGVDAEHGITTFHAEEVMIDRMMIDLSKKHIIVADHSKIGRAGFSRICGVHDGLIIITGSGSDRAAQEQMEQAGATVCVVKL